MREGEAKLRKISDPRKIELARMARTQTPAKNQRRTMPVKQRRRAPTREQTSIDQQAKIHVLRRRGKHTRSKEAAFAVTHQRGGSCSDGRPRAVDATRPQWMPTVKRQQEGEARATDGASCAFSTCGFGCQFLFYTFLFFFCATLAFCAPECRKGTRIERKSMATVWGCRASKERRRDGTR